MDSNVNAELEIQVLRRHYNGAALCRYEHTTAQIQLTTFPLAPPFN